MSRLSTTVIPQALRSTVGAFKRSEEHGLGSQNHCHYQWSIVAGWLMHNRERPSVFMSKSRSVDPWVILRCDISFSTGLRVKHSLYGCLSAKERNCCDRVDLGFYGHMREWISRAQSIQSVTFPVHPPLSKQLATYMGWVLLARLGLRLAHVLRILGDGQEHWHDCLNGASQRKVS